MATSVPPPSSPPLHDPSCEQTEEDLARMQKVILQDPTSIDKICVVETENIRVELTPVMLAIRQGHLKCVKFLVENGATVKLYPILGQDALNQAIKCKNVSIVKYLLDTGMSPNTENCNHLYSTIRHCRTERYLSEAVSLDNHEVVQTLINAGAMLQDLSYIPYNNEYNKLLLTPIVLATFLGCVNSLKILLLNGAIYDFSKKAYLEIGFGQQFFLNLPLQFVVSFVPSLETRLKIMYLLHSFGLSFTKKLIMGCSPIEILENEVLLVESRSIFRFPENMPQLQINSCTFSKAHKEVLVAKMKAISSTPRSLKSQTRLCIINHMGRRFLRDFEKLAAHLPKEVCQFLLFQTYSDE